ncbi:gliding motility-associated C-terminal domain-containing protein, partial [Flavobacterium sp.]|uniref:gliding motility-associated C-terminal domain-containing protein n=1 Tax=Flavobacterium sp. TaxID=239 RepID=UPI002B4B021A
ITLSGCNGTFPAPNIAVVTNEADNCGTPTVAFVSDGTPNLIGCTETTVRTYSVTDACGNSIIVTQNLIRTVDITAPAINTQASNITVQCDGQGNQSAIANWLANNGGAVATDLCGAIIWSNNYSSITNDCSAAVTVIFTATDSCGNFSTTSATFNVNDTIDPNIITPANNITVECDGLGNTAALQSWLASNGGATASDDCSAVSWSNNFNGITNTCGLSGFVSVIFTATDSCGNNSSSTGVFTIQDTTSPIFTIPANVTIFTNATCNYDASVAITGDVIGEADICSTGIQAAYADTILPGACQGSYIITRNWSLIDSCGNEALNQVQTITVLDNLAPTFTIPANMTVFTDAACAYNTSVTITGDVIDEADNCSTGIQATYVDAIVPGECLGSYIITRTWSLVDYCGNEAPDQVQTITVLDNIAPTFTIPANMTVFTDSACAYDASIVVTGDVTDEADNCSTAIQATHVDTIVPGECQGSYVITRTWSLVDNCDNAAANQVQTITVLDNIAPTFTIPANMTVFTDEACVFDASIVVTGDVIDEADNCSTGIQATFIDVTVPGECQGSFIRTRTWSLIDNCGNAAPDQVQTITILDNLVPKFTIPANITVYADANCVYDASINVTGDVTDELDNCSTGIQATFVDVTVPGQCQGSYVITRTWSLVDYCGNAAPDLVQTITVLDNIAPTFTIPANITIYSDSNCPYDVSVTVTGDVTDEADNCSTGLQATYVDTIAPGECEGSYIITRTWSLIDNCQNPALDQIQTISIQDNIAPILTNPIPSEITVNCDEIPIVLPLEFTDSCSNPVIPMFEETLPVYNPDGSGYVIVRTWTAADSCDNQTIVTQTVNVIIQRYLIEIPAEACNGDSSPIDLNSLIAGDVDYVAGGIWTDLSNSGGLNDTNDGIFSPFGIPVGSYTLEYQMNDQLCPRKIQVNMSINTDCIVLACGNIIVHNAFSPNNDGLNEVFTIENIDDIACYPTNRVEIYNRWGILVYEADGYDNNTKAFRGISEGRSTVNQSKELPTGTYFYILQYSTIEGTVVKESKYLYLSR